jgi:signal transduction histidine kinase
MRGKGSNAVQRPRRSIAGSHDPVARRGGAQPSAISTNGAVWYARAAVAVAVSRVYCWRVSSAHSTISPNDAARERAILRDLAHTLARAERPDAVYTVALERVTPWIGASFSSVFVHDSDPTALTLAAAYKWPQRYRDWIGALRVRVGRGPSGLAVGEGRLVEVADLFLDPELTEWQDVARELDMRSMLAAPLRASTGVLGALTFYFANETAISDRERELVESVADHVALAAERTMLDQELRRRHAALVDANAELERQVADAVRARTAHDRFVGAYSAHLTSALGDLSAMLTEPSDGAIPLKRVASMIDAIADTTCEVEQLALLRGGELPVRLVDIDPRAPMRIVTDALRATGTTVSLRVQEPTTQLPTVRTDEEAITTVLRWLLDHAVREARDGAIDVSCALDRGWVAWRIAYASRHASHDRMTAAFDESRAFSPAANAAAGVRLPLARRWISRLGGELRWDEDATLGAAFSLILPLDADLDGSATDSTE